MASLLLVLSATECDCSGNVDTVFFVFRKNLNMGKPANDAPKEECSKKVESIDALRYWVREATIAVQGVAYIEAFEANRAKYYNSKDAKSELSNPEYNPQGRMAIMCLRAVTDSLILFCGKAVDADCRTLRISKLKNDMVENERLSAAGMNSYEINKFFSERKKILKRKTDKISTLRNKLVAHVEIDPALNGAIEGTPKMIIEASNEVIEHIKCLEEYSGFASSGDNLKFARHAKSARDDAEEFWASNFALWAK